MIRIPIILKYDALLLPLISTIIVISYLSQLLTGMSVYGVIGKYVPCLIQYFKKIESTYESCFLYI